MAITILSEPLLIQPVYNPLYLKVSSDNTSEEAFNFTFDTYVNGAFINRSRLLARPGTNEAIFSPARILESYVSYDLTHNIITDTQSVNCVDQYTVVCGEEYVSPWHFFDNEIILGGPLAGYLSFRTTGTTANPYLAGDSIFVEQDAGYVYQQYNGTFTVVSANSDTVIVDMLWIGTTPYNPGIITYSDRRKTLYTGATEYLSNPNMTTSLANWTLADDGWTNTLTLPSTRLILTVGDMGKFKTSDSNYFISTGSTSETLIEGINYNLDISVPYIFKTTGAIQYVQAFVGGTAGAQHIGEGIFNESIICGTGSTFEVKLYLSGVTFVDDQTVEIDYINLLSINGTSGYTFNGTAQYEEIPTWDYHQFYLSGSTSKFLTNQPSTVYTRLDDMGSIGYMKLYPYSGTVEYYMNVDITNTTGNTSYIYELTTTLESTGGTNSLIGSFGIYPWNLNQMGDGEIINANTISYNVWIYKNIPAFDQISEIKTFVIDDCSKYDKVRFMFLNSLGQFDYFNATLVSRENINISRTGYQKVLPYNYSVGDRGRTNLNIEAQQSYTVVSNWISEDTCDWLMELFTSIEVYVINDDASLMPVIIDNNSVENKKRVNDGMLNYTFNYSKAVMKNTLRG